MASGGTVRDLLIQTKAYGLTLFDSIDQKSKVVEGSLSQLVFKSLYTTAFPRWARYKFRPELSVGQEFYDLCCNSCEQGSLY